MKKFYLSILFVAITLISFSQKKLGVTEYITNTTLGIRGNGKTIVNGTGLFFVFQTTKGAVPSVVTSKHLVDSAQTLTFYFLESSFAGLPQYGKQQEITVAKSDLVVLNHPDVDLAIIPITQVLTHFITKRIQISYHPLGETVIAKDSLIKTLNPVETVYLIGYPAAIRKEIGGTPFVKKGITATPMFFDFNQRKEFLIDVSSYDGSLGAPVFIYQNGQSDRNDERMDGQRMLLAGINVGTFTNGFKERIYPDTFRNIPQENTSVVIKAQKILDFKKMLEELK